MDVDNNNKLKIASDISQTSEYRNLLGKISDTYSQADIPHVSGNSISFLLIAVLAI